MSNHAQDPGGEVVAGRLVLEGRITPGRLEIREGRIARVIPDPTAEGGPLVCPGFVDVHVHGWGGHDAMAGREAMAGMARALLARGVTSFLPTAVTAPFEALEAFAASARALMQEPPADGAEPLGFDFEGPYISAAKKGAQNEAFIQSPATADRQRLAGVVDGLRLIHIAPEVEGALELITWLVERGVAVALGHSDATVEQARAGYAAGARSATHLFNAMSGVHQHAPGLAVAALADDGAYVELIADGYHVDRSLWPLILRTKPAGRVLLVSDAVSLAGTGEGRTNLGGLEVEVRDEQCRLISDGRLAGSVIALDSAVRNLVGAGVPLPVAVGAAGRVPLELLGITDRGRLAPGLRADLAVLDEELRVTRVMRAGRWFAGAAGALP
jgi:N-acetylglucosamine-6-phosphate deacetylase